MSVASLLVKLGLNNAQFLAGLDGARSAVRGFNRVASGAATATSVAFRTMTGSVRGTVTLFHELNGAAQSVRAILTTLSMPVKLAADVESARVRFRVLVGDLQKADDIFRSLEKLADDNPILGMTEVANAAAQLASTSFDANKIPDFLTNLGEAATDGQKFVQMVTAASQVLAKGGKVQGDELLQFAEAGLPVIEEMAKVLGVTGGEFAKMQEKGEVTFATLEQAISNLTTGTGRFAGASSAAADTLAGKWAALSATIQRVLRTLGDKVIDGISPIFANATEWAEKLVPLAEQAGLAIRRAITFVTEGISQNKLGEIVADSLKLGALQFLDLMDRGLTAIMRNMREDLADWGQELGDKLTLANPLEAAFNKDKFKRAAERQTQREQDDQMGRSRGKSLRQHFDETNPSTEAWQRELKKSIAANVAKVNQGAVNREIEIENQRSEAGNKNGTDSAEVKRRIAKVEASTNAAIEKGKAMGLTDAQMNPVSSFKSAEDMEIAKRKASTEAAMARGRAMGLTDAQMNSVTGGEPAPAAGPAAAAKPAAGGDDGDDGPAAGGGGGARRGAAGGGGGGGGGGDMSWINRRNEAAGRARGLVKSYRAQAKGSGHQNWQEFLSSGVRTAGLKPAQLSKLRGMDPNALAANITNRKGRAAREEERNSADATAQKSQAMADTIVRDMPGMRDGIEVMKNHLSKLQTE